MASPPASRSDLVRTHILLPRKLIDALDAHVGPRKRSAFVAEAVEARLRREALERMLTAIEQSEMTPTNPAWETSESAQRWVRALREEADDRHGLDLARGHES